MATTKATTDKPAKSEPMFEKRNDSVADDAALAPLEKDIDSRMAALLKDHQAMGARPK